MSIFIGKDSSNTNMVHISKGVISDSTLSNGAILDTTIYNSKLPLSSYRLIPINRKFVRPFSEVAGWSTGQQYAMVSTCFVGNANSRALDVPILELTGYDIDTNDYSFLVNHLKTKPNRLLFLNADFTVASVVGISNIISLGSYSSNYGQEWTTSISTQYTFGLARFRYQDEINVKYILIIIDDYYPASYGEVVVNNLGIFVGGVNSLANKSLITSFPSIGSIYITDGLYLTNTNVSNSGLELSVDPISIKIGGVEIFNSLYSSFMPFKSKTLINNGIQMGYTSSIRRDLLYTLKDTESFCIVGIESDYEFIIRKPYIMVTRNTDNIILFAFRRRSTSGALSLCFAYIYSSNGSVYVRTKIDGGYPSFDMYGLFSIEAF